MSWRIESATTRHGKWVEWTITKGTNKYGDGPAATVCTVTSSREDAALIAAAPKLQEALTKITADYFLWCEPDMTNDYDIKLHKVMLDAVAALNASRGKA